MNTGNGRMAILLAAAEKRVLELVSQSQASREIAASWGAVLPQLSDTWKIFRETWLCALLQARAPLAPAAL